MTTSQVSNRTATKMLTGPWWMFLVTGVLWLIVAWIVLRFQETSIVAVGVIIGVVFMMGAINEFLIASVVDGWKWLHIALGVLFTLGAIWGFVTPNDAFWTLASIIGLIFIMKGAFDIIEAIMTKDYNDIWWLGLVAGIIEVLLGFWASQQFYPARAALILLWVGLFALFRGIAEIVLAFRVKKLEEAA
jgi:uncharacterized membrane protein HdeD (DUF308 family)